MNFVSLTKAKGSDIKMAIEKSLDLIEYKFPDNVHRVVIKPNLCYYWDYTTGQTTDPHFVVQLIELIREQTARNATISIVESDASAMKCKYAFRFLGYEKLAKDYGVKLVNLSEDKGEKIKIKVENEDFEFIVPETIKNADLRINVPKIKYMSYTKISCALKNIFGCNPEPKKFRHHPKLDEAIVALNKLMKFDLCILDGLIVSGIHPLKLGLVMASQDPVAFDCAAAKIAGVNPKSVRHIMLASREGLGNYNFIPRGEDLRYFAKLFPKRRFRDKILSSAYVFAMKTGLLKADTL